MIRTSVSALMWLFMGKRKSGHDKKNHIIVYARSGFRGCA